MAATPRIFGILHPTVIPTNYTESPDPDPDTT